MGPVERYSDIFRTRVSGRAALAEFIGTAILVFLGTGAFVGLGREHEYNLFVVAAAFGLLLTVLTYATAHTSGGELNPALSTALVASGYASFFQGMINIIMQLLGAIVGSLLLWSLMPKGSHSDLGRNYLPSDGSARVVWQALLAEILGTFIFVYVLLEIKFNPKARATAAYPAVAGITWFVAILALGPLTSGSFNPARSFGPAVVTRHWRNLWVFILGPLIGALLAVPAHLVFVAEWDTFEDFPTRSQVMAGAHRHDEGQGPNDPLVPTSTGSIPPGRERRLGLD